MRGPEDAVEALRALLEAELPDALEAIDARLDLEGTLPAPAVVAAREVYGLETDGFPAVMVVAQELVGFRRVDIAEAGGPVYAARYDVAVFSWVMGADVDDTDLLRKRYALAIREVLLAGQVLDDTGSRLLDTTLRETYSTIERPEDLDANVAATRTTVAVELVETLELEGVPFSALGIEVRPMHPAEV